MRLFLTLLSWDINFYEIVNLFEYLIIAYVALISAIYFLLMTLGYFTLRRYHARFKRAELSALLKSSLLPAVSVLAPAYNESATIKESVRAMLKLHYPNHEVIVINDGSSDDTLAILIDEFKLYKSSRKPTEAISTKPIRGIYESRDPIRLLVIDKENGGKADSLNAGLNVARTPLVAAVDSDSLLESDALLLSIKPFLEDPERTIACGGIIRVVNGCDVEQGRVTRIAAPDSMLARFQTVEYLRAFLGGRVAFSFINAMLIISGAFGVFRRDAVMAVGGFVTETVGEDMELVVRLHRTWREAFKDYRIVFVPEPVCWTEVPENLKTLHRQRNRWQRGTVESLWLHRKVLFNPKFGVLGLFAFPYFLMFEMLGPLVEVTGYFLTVIGLLFNVISIQVALLFFLVSVVFGILLSVSALLLEELTLRRYPSVNDLLKLLGAAILENFGFRQLMTLWRAQGLIDGIRKKQGWGAMERKGFQVAPKPPPTSVEP
jgi:cellulose synthase/poly-beta-1,6-N-acetylglucosamine synthase-like glycosyltransferase